MVVSLLDFGDGFDLVAVDLVFTCFVTCVVLCVLLLVMFDLLFVCLRIAEYLAVGWLFWFC